MLEYCKAIIQLLFATVDMLQDDHARCIEINISFPNFSDS